MALVMYALNLIIRKRNVVEIETEKNYKSF